MDATFFDTLDFYEKLVNAGFNDQQARVFADCMRIQNEANATALRHYNEASAAALRDYAEKQENRAKEELTTKRDISDVRLEMARMEIRLIKWIMGVGTASLITLGGMMARGFGWW